MMRFNIHAYRDRRKTESYRLTRHYNVPMWIFFPMLRVKFAIDGNYLCGRTYVFMGAAFYVIVYTSAHFTGY